ncbi:MAG TPA: DinB family protein [Gemmatimonadales bacterium]|nr:DinB family protein [Gemmatimonadales bacterium]
MNHRAHAAPASAGFRPLLEQLAWADERALQTLRSSPADEPRARELLAHVIGAETVWLARIEGREPDLAVWPPLTLDECEAASRRVRAGYAALLARIESDPAELTRMVHYRNSAGLEFDSSVTDILRHVALHGAYHRGQVALLARMSGIAPQATDYIAWARGAPAASRTT